MTGIAKGSLEELRLDYEDFLRQRGLPQWAPDHPALTRFKARRCATMDEFRVWVAEEIKREEKNTDKQGLAQTKNISPPDGVGVSPCSSVFPKSLPAVLAADGALSLLNLCIYLLDRQIEAQAKAFEKEGGFTERLYRRRTEIRNQRNDSPWRT